MSVDLQQAGEQTLRDSVTGLPDRHAFESLLEEQLAELQHDGRLAAVLVVGISRLARVREAYGFSLADEVVRRLADRLRGSLGPSYLLARIGDDEFALAWSAPRVA